MRWTLVKEINKMDYGLKEKNETFFFYDIIYRRHKQLIKLNKKHLQKQKTQHSLKRNAYNECCARD